MLPSSLTRDLPDYPSTKLNSIPILPHSIASKQSEAGKADSFETNYGFAPETKLAEIDTLADLLNSRADRLSSLIKENEVKLILESPQLLELSAVINAFLGTNPACTEAMKDFAQSVRDDPLHEKCVDDQTCDDNLSVALEGKSCQKDVSELMRQVVSSIVTPVYLSPIKGTSERMSHISQIAVSNMIHSYLSSLTDSSLLKTFEKEVVEYSSVISRCVSTRETLVNQIENDFEISICAKDKDACVAYIDSQCSDVTGYEDKLSLFISNYVQPTLVSQMHSAEKNFFDLEFESIRSRRLDKDSAAEWKSLKESDYAAVDTFITEENKANCQQKVAEFIASQIEILSGILSNECFTDDCLQKIVSRLLAENKSADASCPFNSSSYPAKTHTLKVIQNGSLKHFTSQKVALQKKISSIHTDIFSEESYSAFLDSFANAEQKATISDLRSFVTDYSANCISKMETFVSNINVNLSSCATKAGCAANWKSVVDEGVCERDVLNTLNDQVVIPVAFTFINSFEPQKTYCSQFDHDTESEFSFNFEGLKKNDHNEIAMQRFLTLMNLKEDEILPLPCVITLTPVEEKILSDRFDILRESTAHIASPMSLPQAGSLLSTLSSFYFDSERIDQASTRRRSGTGIYMANKFLVLANILAAHQMFEVQKVEGAADQVVYKSPLTFLFGGIEKEVVMPLLPAESDFKHVFEEAIATIEKNSPVLFDAFFTTSIPAKDEDTRKNLDDLLSELSSLIISTSTAIHEFKDFFNGIRREMIQKNVSYKLRVMSVNPVDYQFHYRVFNHILPAVDHLKFATSHLSESPDSWYNLYKSSVLDVFRGIEKTLIFLTQLNVSETTSKLEDMKENLLALNPVLKFSRNNKRMMRIGQLVSLVNAVTNVALPSAPHLVSKNYLSMIERVSAAHLGQNIIKKLEAANWSTAISVASRDDPSQAGQSTGPSVDSAAFMELMSTPFLTNARKSVEMAFDALAEEIIQSPSTAEDRLLFLYDTFYKMKMLSTLFDSVFLRSDVDVKIPTLYLFRHQLANMIEAVESNPFFQTEKDKQVENIIPVVADNETPFANINLRLFHLLKKDCEDEEKQIFTFKNDAAVRQIAKIASQFSIAQASLFEHLVWDLYRRVTLNSANKEEDIKDDEPLPVDEGESRKSDGKLWLWIMLGVFGVVGTAVAVGFFVIRRRKLSRLIDQTDNMNTPLTGN